MSWWRGMRPLSESGWMKRGSPRRRKCAGPSAFAAVSQRARVANWCLGAAIILTLVALAGLWFAQGYPRYDASRQIEAARVAQIAAERAADASRAAELRSKVAEESARLGQAQPEARLKGVRRRISD